MSGCPLLYDLTRRSVLCAIASLISSSRSVSVALQRWRWLRLTAAATARVLLLVLLLPVLVPSLDCRACIIAAMIAVEMWLICYRTEHRAVVCLPAKN